MLAWQTDTCEPITQRFQEQRLTHSASYSISARHSAKQLVHFKHSHYTHISNIRCSENNVNFLYLANLHILPLARTRTKFGERGFFYSGPAAWNTLPLDLHDITDTSTFRKRLKNVLFDRAYN